MRAVPVPTSNTLALMPANCTASLAKLVLTSVKSMASYSIASSRSSITSGSKILSIEKLSLGITIFTIHRIGGFFTVGKEFFLSIITPLTTV